MLLRVLGARPNAVFKFDDDSPFFDASGYGKAATATGTPAVHGSLVSGMATSRVFGQGAVATLESGVFTSNAQEFTLQATFVPIAKSDETSDVIQILGHAGADDGIMVDGTTVSFVTKYPNTGEARAAYDLQELANVNVWGVHTPGKNSLFVNGVLVAEAEISAEQQLDDFAFGTPNLSVGSTSSTRQAAVAFVATYPTALNAPDINSQQVWSRPKESVSSIVAQNHGTRIPLDQSQFELFAYKLWTNAEQWDVGFYNNTIMVDNAIVPVYANDVSIPGEWVDSIFLDDAGNDEIYSVSVGWDGVGGIVEASLDGETWEPLTNGYPVPFIENGFDPTNKFLFVKIRFPGGLPNDPSYVDNLEVVGFRTGTPLTAAGRTITYPANAFVQKDFDPVQRSDNWGVTLNGGSLSIGPSSAPASPAIVAVELWVKQLAGTAFTTNTGTGTTYVNGGADEPLREGEWTLVHIVPETPLSGGFTVGGKVQVGHIVLYEAAIDPSLIANSYTTPRTHLSQETDILTVDSETGMVAKIYAHEWVIAGSG